MSTQTTEQPQTPAGQQVPAAAQVADASTLDQRREKARVAQEVADRALESVTAIDAQLAANTAQTERDQAGLRHARDEIVRLKHALKTAAKDRNTLRKRQGKAGAAALKAKARAQRAEKRYDQEVLVEIVRREKDRDRAAASAVEAAHPAPAV